MSKVALQSCMHASLFSLLCLDNVYSGKKQKKRQWALFHHAMHKTIPCSSISQMFLMSGYLVYEEIKFLSYLPKKYGLLRFIFSMGTFVSMFWKALEPRRSLPPFPIPHWQEPAHQLCSPWHSETDLIRCQTCPSVAIFKPALWHQASESLQQQCKTHLLVSDLRLQRNPKQDPKQRLYQRIQIQLHSWVQLPFKEKNNVFLVEQTGNTEALFYQINRK